MNLFFLNILKKKFVDFCQAWRIRDGYFKESNSTFGKIYLINTAPYCDSDCTIYSTICLKYLHTETFFLNSFFYFWRKSEIPVCKTGISFKHKVRVFKSNSRGFQNRTFKQLLKLFHLTLRSWSYQPVREMTSPNQIGSPAYTQLKHPKVKKISKEPVLNVIYFFFFFLEIPSD